MSAFLPEQRSRQHLKIHWLHNIDAINKGPDLRPSLWVNCLCPDKCEEPLSAKNYILVDDMQIYVYNNGETFRGSASGKVEFFDVLTNRDISVDFTMGSASSKSYATDITPSDINGPFLIKKDTGISISLTYKGITTKPIIHRNTISECSHLE